MIRLNFSVAGWEFQAAIGTLRQSFGTSVEALHEEISAAREEAYAYQQDLEQGLDWIGETDDEGNIIVDHADILNMKIEGLEEARMALCKAFVLSAFHQWERTIRRWTGKKGDFNVLVAAAAGKGIVVHERLKVVRNLVNSLKHGSNSYGGALVTDWPDLFKAGFQPVSDQDWYGAIQLYEKHVDEVFHILKASGPQMKSAKP